MSAWERERRAVLAYVIEQAKWIPDTAEVQQERDAWVDDLLRILGEEERRP